MTDIKSHLKKYFTSQLLEWHVTDNDRALPWKNEKDPYKIWLSEIILQQTRAQQGLPYFERFITAFPTIIDLANADDGYVFKLWEGLGYYNRCKNMLATARLIANEKNGIFPSSYHEIIALKGVGAYTAAAIASFGFGLPYAVLDGNVYRVLSRFFGIDAPSDTTTGKKLFTALAQELLPGDHSRAYNQAIMDLGATVCTYQIPACYKCPLQTHCFAFQNQLMDTLPVKSKKLTIKTRYFHYLLLRHLGMIWVHKRTEKDIWQNLYEPFLIEADHPLTISELQEHDQFKKAGFKFENIIGEGTYSQKLTHRIIQTSFFTVALTEKYKSDIDNGEWVNEYEIINLPFPKTIISFFQKNSYF